jgi:hypothetical protein
VREPHSVLPPPFVPSRLGCSRLVMTGAASGTTAKSINIRVLAVCSVLLLCAILLNSMGSWQGTARQRSVHEAVLPLQKQPRKSRFARANDPDEPDQVVVVKPSATAPNLLLLAKKEHSLKGWPPPPPPSAIDFASKVDAEAQVLTPSMAGLSCHAREGYDIAGDAAYVWGLAFNVANAAECCAACAAQQQTCGSAAARGKGFWRASRRERTQGRCGGAGRCNAWVFCPGSDDTVGAEDRCFSYTIHNHSRGECWLKHESNMSHPIAAGPTLPGRMRHAPRRDWPWAVAVNVWPWEVPEKIAWQAGLLAERSAPVWRGTQKPDWHHKFCRGKHGPC